MVPPPGPAILLLQRLVYSASEVDGGGAGIPARWLLLALAFVVGFRLALYAFHPEFVTDFDILYHAAVHFLRGENPYPITHQWSYYPLYYPFPAVILAVPFTVLPLEPARAAFDIVVGGVFAYALWRYRGPHALLAVASGAYLFAMRNGQMTPLLVAAAMIPIGVTAGAAVTRAALEGAGAAAVVGELTEIAEGMR